MTGYVTLDAEEELHALVRLALAEDVGPGDRTTAWTVPEGSAGRARILAREDLIVAGTRAAREVFEQVDSELRVEVVRGDGVRAGAGATVLLVQGPLRSILAAERSALNFLGRLSGIASLTRSFVERVAGTGARIVDTRKTTPGWRFLEKAAVRAGGAGNHRMGLYDMVLVKDNHIAAAGGLTAAVEGVRAHNDGLHVEVEVQNMAELEELLGLGVDRVLLDNMDLDSMRAAVARVEALGEDRPEVEASGNVTLDTVRAVAETGVDLVSVGALTHSAPSADLSLELVDGA